MAAPTPQDLSVFIGRQVDSGQAEAVLTIVSALATSYTRGNGFSQLGEPNGDIRAVIMTAAARLLTDPSQNLTDRQMGPFRVSYRQDGSSWTTAELAVLNRYRERAR